MKSLKLDLLRFIIIAYAFFATQAWYHWAMEPEQCSLRGMVQVDALMHMSLKDLTQYQI